MISENLRNAISLQESVDGARRFDSQTGLQTDLYGQAVAPANLSAKQAKEQGLMTSGTYGRTSTTLSKSVALAQSLVSRLQARMDCDGSILYKMTWKERVMPSQRSIFALRASAHRTSGKDRGGWVTASSRDWKDTAGMSVMGVNPDGSKRNRADQLPRQAQLAGWPTTTTDANRGIKYDPMQKNMTMNMAAARVIPSGQMLTGCSAGMESGGQLNPEHSRWVMGYRPEWCACAVTATLLFPK